MCSSLKVPTALLPSVVLGTFATREREAIENGNLRVLEPDTSLLVERVGQVTFSGE